MEHKLADAIARFSGSIPFVYPAMLVLCIAASFLADSIHGSQVCLLDFLLPNALKKVSFIALSTLAISFGFLAAPLRAQFVYVTNEISPSASGFISGYSIDHQTGA